MALGVFLGTLLWNGLFLLAQVSGVMPAELAWDGIKVTYLLAGIWFLLFASAGGWRD